MKKQFLMISTIILALLLLVGGAFAQDADKKMKMDGDMMAQMQKSPQHMMMMAHRQNILNFAKTLRDMAAGGKFEDVELARSAFAEIKNSMAKMNDIHQSHMSKMTPEMREKMMPMMEKMQAQRAAMKEHIEAIDKALQTAAPNTQEIEQQAAALIEQMEKMQMPDMQMKMSDKKKM